MDIVKNEIYGIKYRKANYEKSTRLKNFVIRNKVILILVILGLAVASINCVLIYNFVKVLATLV